MSLGWKATRWHCEPERSCLLATSEELAKFLHSLFYDAQSNRSQSGLVASFPLFVGDVQAVVRLAIIIPFGRHEWELPLVGYPGILQVLMQTQNVPSV